MNVSVASTVGHLGCCWPQVDFQVFDGAAGGTHEVWMRRGIATIIAALAAGGKLQARPPSVQKAMLTPSAVLAYWMRGSMIRQPP